MISTKNELSDGHLGKSARKSGEMGEMKSSRFNFEIFNELRRKIEEKLQHNYVAKYPEASRVLRGRIQRSVDHMERWMKPMTTKGFTHEQHMMQEEMITHEIQREMIFIQKIWYDFKQLASQCDHEVCSPSTWLGKAFFEDLVRKQREDGVVSTSFYHVMTQCIIL